MKKTVFILSWLTLACVVALFWTFYTMFLPFIIIGCLALSTLEWAEDAVAKGYQAAPVGLKERLSVFAFPIIWGMMLLSRTHAEYHERNVGEEDPAIINPKK